MTTEEKLSYFLETSVETCQAQCSEMLADYQKTLDRMFEEHKAQTLAQAQMEIKSETEVIRREGNQTLAHDHLHIRRKINKKLGELTDKLFQEVSDLLEEYKKTPAYDELLLKEIRSDMGFAKQEPIVIYIDPVDADKKEALEKATNATLTISEYSFGGGVRAVISSRNILIDQSFDTKLAEAKTNFRFIGGEANAE